MQKQQSLALSLQHLVFSTQSLSLSLQHVVFSTQSLALSLQHLVFSTQSFALSLQHLVFSTQSLALSLQHLVFTFYTSRKYLTCFIKNDKYRINSNPEVGCASANFPISGATARCTSCKFAELSARAGVYQFRLGCLVNI